MTRLSQRLNETIFTVRHFFLFWSIAWYLVLSRDSWSAGESRLLLSAGACGGGIDCYAPIKPDDFIWKEPEKRQLGRPAKPIVWFQIASQTQYCNFLSFGSCNEDTYFETFEMNFNSKFANSEPIYLFWSNSKTSLSNSNGVGQTLHRIVLCFSVSQHTCSVFGQTASPPEYYQKGTNFWNAQVTSI